jgi:hypothetical protein
MKNKNFDCIVTMGDSWSWGSELPEETRISDRFDTLLANQLGVESVNLARESATNFCYKWHWIDWLDSNPTCKNPLIIVQITRPNRHLIYNNYADFFQESPGRLISEEMVQANWGNGTHTGGFIRAFPNHVDFPDPVKKRCQENFYRYNYDDKMAEITVIWEIKLLDLMLREFGGQPIFWTQYHPYQQVRMPWAQQLLANCLLVNELQPLDLDASWYVGKVGKSHPNARGHQYIMGVLEQAIRG